MKTLFRKSLLLAMAAASSSVSAQDDASASGEAAPAVAQTPPVNISGQNIFSVPSLKKQWDAQAVLNQREDKIAFMTSDEDVVIVQSISGLVTVMNAENGRQYWSTLVGRRGDTSLPATTDSELVTIMTGPVVHAFEKFTGKKLFSYRLPHNPASAPVIVRREISYGGVPRMARFFYVPTLDGSVVAFDIDLLERLGRLGTLPPDAARAEQWRFIVGEDISFGIVAGTDRLAFGTSAGNLFSTGIFGGAAGKARFQVLLESPVSAPVALSVRGADERVITATEDGRLFCVDLKSSGEMIWDRSIGVPVQQSMLTLKDDLFFVTHNGVLSKHSVVSGDSALIEQGTGSVAAQSESKPGEVRSYGASVEVNIHGLTEFAPFQIANRSTGQEIRSLTLDLTKLPLTFVASEQDAAVPQLKVLANGEELTGMRSMALSPDRKLLTLEFSDFAPDELLYLQLELEHPEVPSWQIRDTHLAGATVKALVSPKRVATSVSTEAFPPRTISGQLATTSLPWSVSGVRQIVAASETTLYYMDLYGRLIGVNRNSSEPVFSMEMDEHGLRPFNDRTDRVLTITQSGRVSSFAERRIEFGILAIPAGGGITWVVAPKAELSVDFARYHKNPGERPISPEVPAKDPKPAAPAEGQG